MLNPDTVASYQATPEYQAETPEQQQEFDALVIDNNKKDIWRNIGIAKTKEAMLREYAGTGNTQEQTNKIVENRLATIFPEKNPANAQLRHDTERYCRSFALRS